MGLLNAIAYPLNGKNIKNFLLLVVVYFATTSVLNMLPGGGNPISIFMGVFMTGYYYLILQELGLGSQLLPIFTRATPYYRNGGAITLMQIVLTLIVGIPAFILYLGNPVVGVIVGIIIAIPLYWLMAIGTIRYLAEEDWKAMYNISDNLGLLFNHFGASLQMLGYLIVLSVIGGGIVIGAVFGLNAMFAGSRDLTLITMANQVLIFLIAFVLLHGIIANTYIWHSYGLELGLFPLEDEKAKNEAYAFDEKPKFES